MENVGRKILIVEDYADTAMSLADVFELAGYASVIAANEQEAREAFLSNADVAAIAMDGQIPGANPHTGELVRFIRKQGFTGIIVAMSNSSEIREELMAAGCDLKMKKEQVAIELPSLLGNRRA